MRNVLRLHLTLAVLLVAWPACVRAESGTLTLNPTLSKGEAFTLQVVKSRQQSGGTRGFSGRTTSLLDAEVLEAGAEGYVVSATLRKTRFEGAEAERAAANPMVKATMDMWSSVPLHLKLSPQYAVTGLANYEAVRKMFDAFVEKMLASVEIEAEKKEQVRSAMAQLVSSEGAAAQVVSREVALYFSFTGDFEGGADAAPADVLLPSPFGGDPIPAKCTTRVEPAGANSQGPVIVRETTMDSEALAAFMKRFIDDMGRKIGKEPQADAPLPKMTIKDTARVLVDPKTQWPQEVQWQRASTTGPGKRFDGIFITRLAAGSGFTDEAKAETKATSTKNPDDEAAKP
ncbi:MAG: hypothetical protein JXL80_17195 [Planctomycetes bacterium]|nr:hypothetical protein [Planctomycetota bacterium]